MNIRDLFVLGMLEPDHRVHEYVPLWTDDDLVRAVYAVFAS